MSRLVDPTLCPDCRATLDQGRCPACGLVLRGPLADELWRTMVRADALVERLRAAPAEGPITADLPPAPASPAPHAAQAPVAAVPGRAVPALLLALGGLLVFVAVSLFLAVTWSILPLGVKAVLMVGFTAALAAGGYAAAYRGLRGSSEAGWGLAGAVLALDLAAAHRADLFGLGGVGDRAMTIASGAVLVGFGVAASLVVTSTRVRSVLATQVVAVVGLVAVSAAGFWTGPWTAGAAQVLGVVVLAAVAAALWSRMRVIGASAGVLALLTWLELFGIGALQGAVSRGAYWRSGDWWTLLAAAGLAAAVVYVRVLPSLARTVAAGAALEALAACGLQPGTGDTLEALQASAVLLVLAGVTVTGLEPWSRAARVLSGVGAVIGAIALVGVPVAGVLTFVDQRAMTAPDAAFPVWDDVASWTLLAALVATSGAALVAVPPRWVHELVAFLPATALVAVTGVLTGAGAPAWGVAATLAGAAVVALAGGVLSGSRWVVLAGAPGLLAGALALASDRLSVAVAGGLTVLAAATVLLAPVVTRAARVRAATEVAGGVIGLAAVLAASPDGARAALVLTVVGTAVALSSVLRTDRTELGWVATVVLAAGTVVRVAADVRLPEVYALPAAALLVVVGTVRLTRDPQLATWRTLGAGLCLALLPSLLLALPDPGSLRTVLVGVGGAAAVAVGLQRRWQAPFLVGGGVLVVLALRFLLPVAGELLRNPLGAWLLFGAAGAACLLAGVLWEQSLRNLRSASRYVGSLR